MKSKKAVIYARVSTEEQAKEGFSISAQLDELKRYAEQNGFEYIGEYVDEGVSGKSIVGRPEMRKLLRDAERNKFDIVLVYKIDRISRKLKDALDISDVLEKSNVSLICPKENFDMSSPTGKMVFQMMGSFAEFERNTTVDRVKMGMKERAKQGKFNGGICLGYNSKEKRLIINQEEANIVRLIFKYAEEGYGYKAIVHRINELGYRTKKGKLFSTNGVKEILDNPMYIGKIRFNQVENWSEKRRKGKSSNPIISDGEHEPIIEQSQWEKVQTIRKQRSHRPAQSNEPYILRSLLKCPACGSGMVSSRSKIGKDKSYRYYVCGQYHNKGKEACRPHSIRADTAEKQVIDYLANILTYPNALHKIVEQVNRERANAEQPLREELQLVNKKLSKIDTQIKNATDKFLNDVDLQEILAPKLKELQTEKKELTTRLERLSTCLSNCDTDPVDHEAVRRLLSDFQKTLGKLEPEQQKALLHLVIKEITIDKEVLKKGLGRNIKQILLHFDFSVMKDLQSNTSRALQMVYPEFIMPLTDQENELMNKPCKDLTYNISTESSIMGSLMASHDILPLFMIRFPPPNPKRPINLFHQHQPYQLMRKRHLRKRQLRIRPLQHLIRQP